MTATSAEPTRRDFLYIATGAVGAVGVASTLVPLIAQMNPDASTIAAGAPIEVDESRVGLVSRGGPAERAGLRHWAEKYVVNGAYCLQHGIQVGSPLAS